MNQAASGKVRTVGFGDEGIKLALRDGIVAPKELTLNRGIAKGSIRTERAEIHRIALIAGHWDQLVGRHQIDA